MNTDNEILAREIKARTGIAKAFMAFQSTQPMTSIDTEQTMRAIMTPTFMRNVSASELKQDMVEDYILHASLMLSAAQKKGLRTISFPVKKQDEDLLDGLIKNWTEKGFQTVLSETDFTAKNVIYRVVDISF